MTAAEGSPAGTPLHFPGVRLVYLVPADRRPQAEYSQAIGRAARHVQRWYSEQLAGWGSFRLDQPRVEVLATPHPAGWYAQNPQPGEPAGWFWLNAVADAAVVAGAVHDDPAHRWAVYVDAELGPGQNGGAGSGIAVMHRYDLLGLAGRNVLEGFNEDRVCRWVGGLAHELGHTFGLPHPQPCERSPDHPSCRSLMYFGYRDYPHSGLLPEELDQLRASPFFGPAEATPARFGCEDLIG